MNNRCYSYPRNRNFPIFFQGSCCVKVNDSTSKEFLGWTFSSWILVWLLEFMGAKGLPLSELLRGHALRTLQMWPNDNHRAVTGSPQKISSSKNSHLFPLFFQGRLNGFVTLFIPRFYINFVPIINTKKKVVSCRFYQSSKVNSEVCYKNNSYLNCR